MKKIILFWTFITFINFCCIKSYCQTNIIQGNDLEQLIQDDTEENPNFVKIHTPLGHEPTDKQHIVLTSTWTDTEVEKSKQRWLYSGGVFKTSISTTTFTEKNNYIPKNSVLCLSINDNNNIFIGTKEGIYLSTDYGESWLDPANDGIENLPDREVYAILINSEVIYLGTDNGIYKSTNSGESWSDPLLTSKKITCIEFGADGHLFAGVETNDPGVYKSTDDGESWNRTSLTNKVFCLEYDSGILYAGCETGIGLKKSTDNGNSWSQLLFFSDNVTSIFIDGSNIYIGTSTNGCLKSINGGIFYQINNNFPAIGLTGKYYTLNSLQKFDGKLYAATDNGLYNTTFSSISWFDCSIKGSYDTKELLTKMLLINGDDLWVACDENTSRYYFPSAEVLYNLPEPFNPTNFPRYNCHGFAWHLSEGGISGTALSNPSFMNYIPDDLNEQNWDYITTSWDDPLWEKVTYNDSFGHSGIKSPNNDPNETVENNIKIISKWTNAGPLVEHKLRENPWGYNNETVRYWKSKKKISGDITESQEIGRQIITDGSTSVTNGNSVEFRIAPMYDHRIHLTTGFHAERGSMFHAYVDNSKCIPWEEQVTDFIDNVFVTRLDSIFYNEKNSNNDISLNIKKPEVNTIDCTIKSVPWHFSGKGSGTEDDPYQITNIQEFQEITNDEKELNYWILMNDIDASETHKWNPYVNEQGDTIYLGFIPIVKKMKSLDGRGHVIRNLYTINSFLYTQSYCLHLRRIGFENITIEPEYYGISVHRTADSNSVIEECFITGTYRVKTHQIFPIFGFGDFSKDAIVRNCFTNLTIQGDSTIVHFAKVFESAKVSNCYAAGKAIGQYVNPPFYSPNNTGEITSCFYDNETIKVTTNILDRGIGLPTSEMKKREPFEKAGWDFENVWYIDEGMDYPKLRAFKKELSAEKVNQVNEYSLTVSEVQLTSNFKISYEMPVAGSVEIELFNAIGSKVRLLLSESNVQGGSYSINLDASGLSSGLYFVVMKANRVMLSQKIIIIN